MFLINLFKKVINYSFLMSILLVFLVSYLSSAEPQFSHGQSFPNGSGAAVGDVDGDSDFDILIVFQMPMPHGGYCRVFLNDGQGNFSDSGQNLGIYPSNQVYLKDLDKDYDLDAIITGHETRVYFNNGNGMFSDSGQILVPTSGKIGYLALGDLDSDGDIDFVNSDEQPSLLEVFLNDGRGIFSKGQYFGLPWSHGIDLADIDNDGDLDLAAAMNWGPTCIYLNNGDGTFVEHVRIESYRLREGNCGPKFSDLNNDGLIDLIEGNTSTPSNPCYHRIFFNTGNAKYVDSGQRIPSYWAKDLAVCDIDNDGDIDIIEPDSIHFNDGFGFFSESSFKLGDCEKICVADIDGDSDLDLLITTLHINSISSIVANTPPVAPSSCIHHINENTVVLMWTNGFDYQTSSELLTYNIRIGTSPGKCDIYSAEIGPSFTTPSFGNCWHTFNRIFNLPDETYYWSAQTVDTGFMRSSWFPEQKMIVGSILTQVYIDPKVLNLKSQGRYITCYIELPNGYDVDQIDVSTIEIIALNDIPMKSSVYAEIRPTGIGDFNENGIADLMVKFDRKLVCSYLVPGNWRITIAGKLINKTRFLGNCSIRAISF